MVSLGISATGGFLRQVSSQLWLWFQPVDPEPAPKPLIRPVLDCTHTPDRMRQSAGADKGGLVSQRQVMAMSLTEENREIREIRQICYVQDTVREDDLLVLARVGLNVGKGHFLGSEPWAKCYGNGAWSSILIAQGRL